MLTSNTNHRNVRLNSLVKMGSVQIQLFVSLVVAVVAYIAQNQLKSAQKKSWFVGKLKQFAHNLKQLVNHVNLQSYAKAKLSSVNNQPSSVHRQLSIVPNQLVNIFYHLNMRKVKGCPNVNYGNLFALQLSVRHRRLFVAHLGSTVQKLSHTARLQVHTFSICPKKGRLRSSLILPLLNSGMCLNCPNITLAIFVLQ